MAVVARFQSFEIAKQGDVMRARRIEQTALTTFLIASCVTLLLAVFAAQAHNKVAAPLQSPAAAAHHNI
jgi:hypothetical protein